MPEISLGQLLVQGWPVMLAAPGIALALLAIGAVAGWCAKAYTVKILSRTLAEKVDIADRHRAFADAQLLDASTKHADVSAKLLSVTSELSVLTHQVTAGASRPALTSTTASVSEHVIDLTKANETLGHSLASVYMTAGDRHALVLDPASVRANPQDRLVHVITNPQAASPPSPKRPK